MNNDIILDVQVYGIPQAQGRPRARRLKGGRIGMYDPATSKAWKEAIKQQVLLMARPKELYDGPVYMDCTFIRLKPKSLPKRAKHPSQKPDLSNYIKGLEDALVGIVLRDDSQIVELFARKMYGDPPGVKVKVGKL